MQTTGLNRITTDKYYTKSNIVKQCLDSFFQFVQLDSKDLLIEPSAGAGAFSIPLRETHSNTIAYDILPEHKDIEKQDFLSLSTTSFGKKDFKIYVIGNPPFGRQSSLAKKFIKKACEFCDGIAFILPKSFKKKSYQSVFPLDFHLELCLDLDSHSFEVHGVSYDVPCVFQIWIKKSEKRKSIEKIAPLNYSFVNKNESPDFSFRRVGVYAGKLDKQIENKSEQSHYFIKLDSKIDSNHFLRLYQDQVQFETENTVGPKSISKTELIEKLNSLFENSVEI